MKTRLHPRLIACATAALLGAAGVVCQPAFAQQHVTSGASSAVSVSTVNGQSVVNVNGKEVYHGPTTGQVASRSSNLNGVEYSAVFDGDKLLWENLPGAGQQLQSQSGAAAGVDLKQFNAQHQQMVERMKEEQRKFMQSQGGKLAGGGLALPQSQRASQSGDAAISLKTINGSTVVVYQGQEFSVGPTKGKVSAQARNIQGKDYAAAFEGDRVIWENLPGAAKEMR
jgi:hypothetical protein